MTPQGYLKLHRKMFDNPVVCKSANHIAVWTYLLAYATHTERDDMFKGKRITLKPGQMLIGRKHIAKKTKVNENTVQKILKLFEMEHQIEQQTSNQNRLITIVKWSEYQIEEHQTEQPRNNGVTTTEQRCNTNKNDKNDKNVKNDKNKRKSIKRKMFGEYKNVPFTDEELEKLKNEFPNDYQARIENMSNYCESKGKKYKSGLATIRNWAKRDKPQKITGGSKYAGITER